MPGEAKEGLNRIEQVSYNEIEDDSVLGEGSEQR